MNRDLEAALTFAAVAAAAAAAAATLIVPRSAFAAGDITVDPTPFVSTATREQVRADLMGAAQFARDTEWVQQGNAAAPFKSSVAPRELREQYKASRDEVSALTREDSGAMYLKRAAAGNPTAVMGGPAR
jgi:hypothetical protein